MTEPRSFAIVADTHFGSVWGPWLEGFETVEPRSGDLLSFKPTKTQKALNRHWKKMCAFLEEYPVECIIFNGDICDGNGRRSGGRGLVTPNIRIQAQMASYALDMLPKVPFYFTMGTDYHEMADGQSIEEWLADRYNGTYGMDLRVATCGIVTHVGHFVPVSNTSWQYRTTPLARDLLLLALNDAEERYGKIDLAIRSHAHYFVDVAFSKQMGIISPCWKVRDEYSVKKDLITPPDIGWLIVEVQSPSKILVDRSFLTHIGQPSRLVGPDVDGGKSCDGK